MRALLRARPWVRSSISGSCAIAQTHYQLLLKPNSTLKRTEQLFIVNSPTVAAATSHHVSVCSDAARTAPIAQKIGFVADGVQHVSFCTDAGTRRINLEGCSQEVQDLHKKITNEMEGKRTVSLSLLRALLEQCKVPEDLALAFRVLHDYRLYRSSKAHVKRNFSENISALIALASLRTRTYNLGLKVLWKHNIYGLSPCLDAAHLFLSHAKQEKDLDLMQKTFKTMIDNSLTPTTQTADIVIRLCKDKEDFKLMFKLAQDFLENSVRLSSPVFDVLISTAANFGCVEEVFKAQKWREESGLEHTVASVFAVGKAHLLQGEPHAAVELISTHCQDITKLNKYLIMLVRVWPSELGARKEEIHEDFFVTLKKSVVDLIEALSQKYHHLSIDAAEFGKGKVHLNKDDGVYEVPQLSAVS